MILPRLLLLLAVNLTFLCAPPATAQVVGRPIFAPAPPDRPAVITITRAPRPAPTPPPVVVRPPAPVPAPRPPVAAPTPVESAVPRFPVVPAPVVVGPPVVAVPAAPATIRAASTPAVATLRPTLVVNNQIPAASPTLASAAEETIRMTAPVPTTGPAARAQNATSGGSGIDSGAMKSTLIIIGSLMGTILLCGISVLIYNKCIKKETDEDDGYGIMPAVAKRVTGTFNRTFRQNTKRMSQVGPYAQFKDANPMHQQGPPPRAELNNIVIPKFAQYNTIGRETGPGFVEVTSAPSTPTSPAFHQSYSMSPALYRQPSQRVYSPGAHSQRSSPQPLLMSTPMSSPLTSAPYPPQQYSQPLPMLQSPPLSAPYQNRYQATSAPMSPPPTSFAYPASSGPLPMAMPPTTYPPGQAYDHHPQPPPRTMPYTGAPSPPY
ncbi:hypothetical protein DFJ77DRAFT_478828 [Powellomyces hirtus]|nr:hypothetical protein DFJ77DRAFT_478828 [Powellomyces hirtus]